MIAAAGVAASIAVAKPPPGHGNPHQGSTTTGTTATSTTGTTTTTKGHGKSGGHGKAPGKVLVCHKVGNGHYVLVSVSAKSAPAKGKHGGDVLATNGTCPGPLQGHNGTTTGHDTTTTATTTTAATTTS
jgi:hypothetical protein